MKLLSASPSIESANDPTRQREAAKPVPDRRERSNPRLLESANAFAQRKLQARSPQEKRPSRTPDSDEEKTIRNRDVRLDGFEGFGNP